jgi:glycerol-3-phosphate O-acyltransferase / dihydroxyacetone phosphate acyltransferase
MVSTARMQDPVAAASAQARSEPDEPPRRARRGAIRSALIWAFRRAVGIYFREIDATGNVPTAAVGGRVFVANHVNGLVDPILVLTHAPCAISPVAKSTLWNIPGLRYLLDEVDAVPIVRRKDDPNKKADSNEEIFDRVAAWLASKENILIFPEGTSHNEPHLLQVKSGAARMLARARSRGARGLTFQAVALEFEDRAHFRSRCLLVYGPVREVDELVPPASLGGHPQTPGANDDDLVAKITARLQEDLSELLVEGATWPERLLIARVAEMLANDAGDGSMERWNSIGRQVEAASKVLKRADEATLKRIEEAVSRYYEQLSLEGLVDEQLVVRADDVDGDDERSPVATWARRLGMVAILPLAIAGMGLYFVPYQLPRFVAKRAADDPDVVSTFKLGTGLLVYPVWASLLTAGSLMFLPPPLSIAAVPVILASPFAALAWLDKTPELRRALRFRRKKERLDALRAARGHAMDVIRETRTKLGL